MSQYSAETLELLKEVSTAAITGYLYKKHGMRVRALANVRPLNPGNCRFFGPAYTIRYVPQREDLNTKTDLINPTSLLLRATEEIQAGDVFVIDMQGNKGVGALGDVLVTRLIGVGIAGVVADGGMRDVRETRDMSLPIFCTGPAAPPGPAAIMPAGVQELVGCGGVAVFPGDMVVGDEDGVAIIPAHLVAEVAEQCVAKEKLDLWIRSEVETKGGSIRGLYPPNDDNLARYHATLGKTKT